MSETSRDETFSTQGELDLAVRLLETHDESSLERYLARLLQRTRAATGVDIDDRAIRPLAGLLRRSAYKLGLPHLARLRLAAVKSPGIASRVPGLLSRAGRLLGIELEGLSSEDKELEIARRFVRLAGAGLRQLAARGGGDPRRVASAFARAARTHAPGLLSPDADRTPSSVCGCGCRNGSCGCPKTDPTHPDTASRSLAMHDIDHTRTELDPEAELLELDELDELEYSDEFDEAELGDSEFDAGEYDTGELDAGETDTGEYDAGELDSSELDSGETDSPFSEVEESELANEMLGISNEAEMDQFLGKVLKRAWRGARGLGRSLAPLAGPLKGMLKDAAKKLLPMAGTAAGTFFGGPLGASIGAKLGTAVGNALESEFEGAGPEDREFEKARTFVRMAGSAARQAARAPARAPGNIAARNAMIRASRRAIARRRRRRAANNYSQGYATGRRSGRWVRRGNRIILFGI